MAIEEFLANVKPIDPKDPLNIRLEKSLIDWLDEVAQTRKGTRASVLRDILYPMKAAWENMTPAQRKGAAYDA